MPTSIGWSFRQERTRLDCRLSGPDVRLTAPHGVLWVLPVTGWFLPAACSTGQQSGSRRRRRSLGAASFQNTPGSHSPARQRAPRQGTRVAHDAASQVLGLLPARCPFQIIYMARDARDVALSLYNHYCAFSEEALAVFGPTLPHPPGIEGRSIAWAWAEA
jgi:hypothetical protein